MNDLISRKDVLERLKYEMKYGSIIDQCGLEIAYDIVEVLPPFVEPKQERLCNLCESYLIYKEGCYCNHHSIFVQPDFWCKDFESH